MADSICGLYGMRTLLAVKRPRSWALSGAIAAGLSKRDVSAAHRRVEERHLPVHFYKRRRWLRLSRCYVMQITPHCDSVMEITQH